MRRLLLLCLGMMFILVRVSVNAQDATQTPSPPTPLLFATQPGDTSPTPLVPLLAAPVSIAAPDTPPAFLSDSAHRPILAKNWRWMA